jgi:hypothetical protein
MKKVLLSALGLALFAALAWAQYESVNKTGSSPATTSTAAKTTTAKTTATGKTAVGTNKTADIKKLLTLTKSADLGVQMMQEMLASFRQTMPEVPDKFWLEFAGKVKTEDLIGLMVPIYERHLSHQDVIELIQFFESPAGKKLVSVQPEIMKESMLAGQAWGQQIGMEVVSELQKQGYR